MLNLLHPVKNSQLSAEGSFIRAIKIVIPDFFYTVFKLVRLKCLDKSQNRRLKKRVFIENHVKTL
jgi:hypothetical protein